MANQPTSPPRRSPTRRVRRVRSVRGRTRSPRSRNGNGRQRLPPNHPNRSPSPVHRRSPPRYRDFFETDDETHANVAAV